MSYEADLRDALHLALQATGKRAKEAAFCEGEDALNSLLARHRKEVASARNAALEEAAEALNRIKGNLGGIRAAGMVRAMKKNVTTEWQGERATVENGLVPAPRGMSDRHDSDAS